MITSAGLARFVAELPAGALPDRELAAVERSCFDVVGAAVAGLRDPATRLVAGYVRDRGGRPEAQPLGLPWRTSATGAALLGGVAAQALDLDDMGVFGAASATLLPALLALAESSGDVAGSALVDAYAVGYTAGAALAAGYRPAERGLDPTGVFGTVAAAAAGARLLRLDPTQTRHALGIAASHAGGLGANLGTGTGALHSGLAAAAAVRAVRLAQRGVTAAPDAIEQRRGFHETVTGSGPPAGCWGHDHRHGGREAPARPGSAGEPEAVAVAGTLALRPYPCHPDAHSAVAALLDLRRTHRLDPVEVVEIQVGGLRPGSPVLRQPAPTDGRAARISLRFLLALALCRGRLDLTDLTDQAVNDPLVVATAQRVWLDVLPAWDPQATAAAGTPGRGNPVRVRLAGGRELRRTVPAARLPGAPGRPLPERELVERFQARIGPDRSPATMELIVAAWRRLGSAPDIRASLRTLAGD